MAPPEEELNVACHMCHIREAEVTVREYFCLQCYDRFVKPEGLED